MMGTLTSVWDRLKPLLQSAMKSSPAPSAKADSKKTAVAIDHFITQFAASMKQFETIYHKKAEVDASFKTASEQALKLLAPLLLQIDAAHKEGFNPGSTHDTLDDRMNEMIDRLKELKQYGSQTQWD